MLVQESDTTQDAGPPLDVNQMSFDERLQAGRDCFRFDPSLRWTVECTQYSKVPSQTSATPASCCHLISKQTLEQNVTGDNPEFSRRGVPQRTFLVNVTCISTACGIDKHGSKHAQPTQSHVHEACITCASLYLWQTAQRNP